MEGVGRWVSSPFPEGHETEKKRINVQEKADKWRVSHVSLSNSVRRIGRM